MKTSYSTIFNEGLDFTCALSDAKGDMIACAEFCPTMIGGMPILIKTISQEVDFASLREGDVMLHNDPYRGGLHCPEHTFFKPFFADGQLLGFAVCIGHIAEIGGMVPGAFCGEATEIFHEGLRVPPVHIKKAGVDVEEVWKLLLANTRTPRQNYGDLRAMIGAVDLGVNRIQQIIGKYGLNVFRKTCEDLMDYSERRMRAELSSFPDGVYSFEDVVENDGIEAVPYTVAIDLHIQGDEVVADYSRSSKQAKGPINATVGVATGAVYNGLLHVTDASIPKNSGCFRPIRVVSPPGKVTNVDYPGPLVAGNTETHPRLANIVIGAMSACKPERAMASESCTGTNFVFGGQHPEYDEYFACYDLMSGGWGGRHGHDGNDCVIAINGNCRFNPTEVFEARFPLRVENFELIPDSGGAGQWRGGLGFRRTLLDHRGSHHRQPMQRPTRGEAFRSVWRRARRQWRHQDHASRVTANGGPRRTCSARSRPANTPTSSLSPAIAFCSGRPAEVATAIRRSGTRLWSRRTSPKVTSRPRRPPPFMARRVRRTTVMISPFRRNASASLSQLAVERRWSVTKWRSTAYQAKT